MLISFHSRVQICMIMNNFYNLLSVFDLDVLHETEIQIAFLKSVSVSW